jgi:CheY-like chemotaxis protein
MPKKESTILLVDDSEDDRLFMRRALRKNPQLTIIWEASNGEEVIAYLSGQGLFNDRQKYPIPEVLILDLKMPRKTGYDVLEWLQTQSFNDLIIIVVSGSFLVEDVAKSFALGARAYHKKSASKEEQEKIVHDIEELLANCSYKHQG